MPDDLKIVRNEACRWSFDFPICPIANYETRSNRSMYRKINWGDQYGAKNEPIFMHCTNSNYRFSLVHKIDISSALLARQLNRW